MIFCIAVNLQSGLFFLARVIGTERVGRLLMHSAKGQHDLMGLHEVVMSGSVSGEGGLLLWPLLPVSRGQ